MSAFWQQGLRGRSAQSRVWLADITYLPTQEGFLYLAFFLPLFTIMRGKTILGSRHSPGPTPIGISGSDLLL